jgi:hypothetical protein
MDLKDPTERSPMNDERDDMPAEQAGANLNNVLAEGEGEFVVASGKKAMPRGSLLMFGLLVAGMGAMYLLYLHSGPKAASASVSAEAQAADATIHGFLSSSALTHKKMEQSLKNTEKIVQQFLNYPSAQQVPLAQLTSNPFRQAQAPGTAAGAEQRRESERVALLKAVQALRLQSVIHSDTLSACLIDNTLYREGQTVGDFTIEKINPNAVIVKNGAYRFELRMQH